MSVTSLTQQAEALEAAGRGTEAIELWRQAAELNPSPELRVHLADSLIRHGFVEEGEQTLRRTIEAYPDHPDSYFALGLYFEDAGRLSDAVRILEQGIARRSSAPALVILGDAYRQLNLPEAARRSFQRAVELEPANSEAWYGLGLVERFDDASRAAEFFARSIAADKNHAAAYRELGHMLWRQGKREEAESSIRTALELNDGDPWGHYYLGQLLFLRRCLDDAESAFRSAIRYWDISLFESALGEVLEAKGRMKDAQRAYRRALALDTSNFVANLRYGQWLVNQGRLSSARTYLKRAIRLNPSDSRARKSLADIETR